MDCQRPGPGALEPRRIAVVADIHANMEALTAVLADMAAQSTDALVCLGDCVGYGAEPLEAVRTVAALECPTVMGNHELGLRFPRILAWFNPLARASLEITAGRLDAAARAWIGSLPAVIRRWGGRFVHGLPPASPMRYLFQASSDQLERRMLTMPEPLCFVGHTHRLEVVCQRSDRIERRRLTTTPVLLDPEARYIINVGSVGQPRDGTPEAKYLIWEPDQHRIRLRAVAYPYRAAADKIRRAGLPEAHAMRLLP